MKRAPGDASSLIRCKCGRARGRPSGIDDCITCDAKVARFPNNHVPSTHILLCFDAATIRIRHWGWKNGVKKVTILFRIRSVRLRGCRHGPEHALDQVSLAHAVLADHQLIGAKVAEELG